MAVQAAINSEVARFVGINLSQNHNLVVLWRNTPKEEFVNIRSIRTGKADLDLSQLTMAVGLVDGVQKHLEKLLDDEKKSDDTLLKYVILTITGSTTVDTLARAGPRFSINYTRFTPTDFEWDVTQTSWSHIPPQIQAKVMQLAT